MSPGAATPKRPLLERVGVQYFERRSQALPPVAATQDAVHVLNPEERKGLRRVVLGAVFRSCLAGALSATASAIAEVLADPLVQPETPLFSLASAEYWLILGGVTAVASVIEILFIYWDTLRSVHQLAHVAGLKLFGTEPKEQGQAIAEALARAALELPNPIDSPHRINPRREASKWRLLVASLAYKAKIGVTNFLLKMVVRRVLGRVLVRSVLNTFIPFVAVPVTAAWNGVVSWLVLKEARLRAMGPSAAEELVELVFADAPPLSDAGRLAALRAVAATIVRTQDLHPNLLALLEEVRAHAGDTGAEELDDVGEFLDSLKALPPAELKLTLQLLAVSVIVDGRLSRRERRLYSDALAAAGRPIDLLPVERLCSAFVRGEGVADDAVRAIQ